MKNNLTQKIAASADNVKASSLASNNPLQLLARPKGKGSNPFQLLADAVSRYPSSNKQVMQMKHELGPDNGDWKKPAGFVLDDAFGATLGKKGLNYGYKMGNDNSPVLASSQLSKANAGNMLRPKGKQAFVEKIEKNDSRDQPYIDQYGYVGSQERAVFGRERIQTYDGGHLIGHQFFGKKADVHGNLAPQHNQFNQLSWRLFEEIVQEGFYNPGNKYSSGAYGEEVKVDVSLTYSPDTYQRSLLELHKSGVIDDDQYDCIKTDTPMKDTDQLTFTSFVPVTWSGKAKATDPLAKSQITSRPHKGGYAYNMQQTNSDVEGMVGVDSDDEYMPASQETHGALGNSIIDLTDSTLTFGGNNEESFYGIQSVPRDLSKQKAATLKDYYYLNKSKNGSIKSTILKMIPPNLSKPVSMTHLKTLDIKKSPTVLEAEDDQFAELVDKIGHKTVCKQLVFKLQTSTMPTNKEETKKFLTKVAIASVIKPGTPKTKFLSLWTDSNFGI
ncbi:DNA/RNA non-specific endonuclease [Filimonas lacunae]|uniref:DNA/RNA non-specific endonuclease n=1 Tax=Filimonas lacunae TaxID=477680 RepID=A0A173MII0_9BACT|nr:DNA/RNA non-specific endonuclease [Filimonas lacunae]BAV07405.1 hypothetical protein FLA_3430 [Filimonas lacunae]SIT30482.1 DNA/RNA non-specific endonuclease [Filimonas lacunae]